MNSGTVRVILSDVQPERPMCDSKVDVSFGVVTLLLRPPSSSHRYRWALERQSCVS